MPKYSLFVLMVSIFFAACNNKTTTTSSAHCVNQSSPFDYSWCHFDKTFAQQNLSLYWQANKQPLQTFDSLITHLDTQNDTPTFAMNAGMYDDALTPIGYTVIDSKPIKSLNTKDGKGNFHLMPNGVFWWDNTGFYIDTTATMAQKLSTGTAPKYATQSGPMLVINGQIHPKFDPNSTSVKIRNGVGIDCFDNQLHFIISNEPVNFYQFANVFKSTLGCQNALFLDGGIASALYAPNLNRKDGMNMGVMVVATQQRPD